MEKNLFDELASLDVGAHIEKKGRFSYLSWSYAIDILKRRCPGATWEVVRHNGLPYMETPLGYFVEVAVCVDGVTISHVHPVLDNANKPIQKPNAFQINTSIQRCLVKAIAVSTGLGLYIYSGEDLPNDNEPPVKVNEQAIKEDMIAEIVTIASKLGEKGETMLQEFEEKAKCTIKDMNLNVLKRVLTLLNTELAVVGEK
jgi:uncharacterized protein DUF1071